MSDLPAGWAETTVGDLGPDGDVGILTGPFGSNLGREDFRDTGVPVFTIGCLSEDGVKKSKLLYIDDAKASELATYRLREGDFLFSRMATVGRVGFVPKELEGSIFNYHLMRLRLNEGKIEPRYFFHFVRGASSVADYLESVNRGATRDGINTKLLAAMPVQLAPMQEQCRIVAKLDSLRARSGRARQELDHIPKLIERYKQAILAKAFSGELTKEWRKKNKANDWQPVLIENVADSIFDGPFGSHLKSDDYVNAGVRVIRLENIGHLAFRGDKETFISQEKYDQLRRHTLLPDDVIFSSFVDEEVRVCLFPGDLDTPAINKADCFCIRPNKKTCEPKWLAMRLASRSTYETLRDAVHGATRPRINLGTLKSFSFELPTLKEQREMVRRIEHAFAWLDMIANEHARAEHLLPKLDQAILAKAFRGELVPQDPNDEPASVLLDRIKADREGGTQPRRRAAKA